MKGLVTANRLNARDTPSLNGNVLAVLERKQIVKIIGERSGWYEIPHGTTSAFVSGDYLKIIENRVPLKGRVTASVLNVRDFPGRQGEVIGSLPQHAIVDIMEDEGDWLEIAFNGDIAYVHESFIEQHATATYERGVIRANSLNIRSSPDLNSLIIGQLNKSVKVDIRGKVGNWYEILFNEQKGYLSADYVELITTSSHEAVGSDRAVGAEETPLEPEVKLKLPTTATGKKVATTWNKYGGYLSELSNEMGLDPGVAVAVLCVESSGKGFSPSNNNRMIIRFENHLFWRYWGKDHVNEFNRHFKYGKKENGKTKSWLGHKWRESASDAWGNFHGSQPKEWNVFEFARALDEKAALYSISMGAPQVMGFNYRKIGYRSPVKMFDEFSTDIRAQIKGLFDFFDQRMITALKKQDFVTFAGYYNGSGQKVKYGNWIENHFKAYNSLNS